MRCNTHQTPFPTFKLMYGVFDISESCVNIGKQPVESCGRWGCGSWRGEFLQNVYSIYIYVHTHTYIHRYIYIFTDTDAYLYTYNATYITCAFCYESAWPGRRSAGSSAVVGTISGRWLQKRVLGSLLVYVCRD